MKRERLLMIVGFSLLALTFFAASVNIWRRSASAAKPNQTTIRLAHWQLEPPVRAAFDELARIYMSEHPDVTVEIIAVPERTYAQWFMTRLVGGFAPDITEIRTTDSALIARYFTPLTEWLEKPNPYNAGGSIADSIWRNTFIDGLDNDISYHPQLLDYYNIPVSQFTTRIIYNRTLWRRVLGDTPPPANYAELKALCQRFAAEASKAGIDAVPMLSSSDHSAGVYQRMFTSQTQKLTERIRGTPLHQFNPVDFSTAYVRKEWTLDDPEVASGLSLMRDISFLFQSGYEQIGREDAGFRFLQGGALMIYTGSWDYGSYKGQADFELGVCDLPLPKPGSPGYGQFVVGEPSEGSVATSASFSLARQSPHPDQAIDFLQFITSQRGNRIFSTASGWLPAIVGVEPEPNIKPFYPQIKGVRNGPDLGIFGPQSSATRVILTGRYLLVGPNGSADAYGDYLKENLGPAIREDLERSVAQQNKVIQRQDSIIAAYAQQTGNPAERAHTKIKLRENEESQTLLETLNAWTTFSLNEFPQ